MSKLAALITALAMAPAVGLAALQVTMPVFADTPGVSPTCFPQSVNPHPTDPAGSTTAALFCTSPTPPSATGSGGGSNGSGTPHGARPTGGAGTTEGGSQTTLATTTEPGSDSGAFDSGARLDGRPDYATSSGTPSGGAGSSANASGLFGDLVGFFSATGGLVFLFGLLVLMAIVLIAAGVIAWLRRGRASSWASRAARLTFRAKS